MAANKKVIWDTLSEINVEPYIKFREPVVGTSAGPVPYLPWTKMHVLMMAHFPEYEWSFSEDHHKREAHYYEGGSCEVRCTMSIGEHTIITSLPVVDGLTPEANPDSRHIANAKQRCRVKCAAEFGLGFSLWATPEAFIPRERVKSKQQPEEPTAVPEAAEKKNIISEEEYFVKYVQKTKTRAAALAGRKKLLSALKNRKRSPEKVEQMWIDLCQANGWEQ